MQRIKVGYWLGMVFVAALAGFAPRGHAQDLENGLVARYALDGDLTDDGPNGYNGRAVGAPVYTRGLLGQALRFDGTDDIAQFTGIPSTVFNGTFSASWFMQVDELQQYSLMSKRDACTVGNHFDVQLGDGSREEIGFNLSRTGQIGTTTARATAEEGPWIHVAIVRDATSARVYVDGRAGPSVNVGTLNFSAVTSALAFGGSPCVGTIGGPRRYRGLLDELRVYERALSAAEVGSLSRLTSLTVTPGSASPGSRITMAMNNLEAGRSYELRLRQGRSVNQLLSTLTNVAASATSSVTLPVVAAGDYEIALLQRQPLQLTGGTLVRTVPFTVVGGLTFSNITAQPQAGKRMQVTIGNLAPGSLQLKYNGRIVAGPVPVDTPTRALRFLAPADIPASFPATVTLRAELLSGRVVTRTGTTTITVVAPFSGVFSTITGITSSNPTPRLRDPVRVTGRLNLADGATPADVDVSAYWVGANGRVTPLPTTALTVAADGQFSLDTRPGGLGAMTAFVPSGSGRIRLVSTRVNVETGRPEVQVTEGPNLDPVIDTDPQTDITVQVRARVGNNTTVPLAGAFAVLDANAPIQLFDPPPPSGGQSSFSTGGPGLVLNRQPAYTIGSAAGLVVNQVRSVIDSIQLPPPECGNSLRRRYTNAQGEAEFLIAGDVGGAPGTWQALMNTQFNAVACSGVGCGTAVATPIYELYLTVYTLHLGAGYREDNNSNAEIPSRFRIRYNRDTGSFEIRNERTGVTTTQQTSVNLVVEVPAITQLGGFVTITDPLMFQTVGTDYYLVQRQGSTGYGRWVDFDAVAGTFINSIAPVRHIRFGHRPDAGGSLVSAKLYLPNLITGAPSEVGSFVRLNNVPGCNIQDDPDDLAVETWELRIDGALSQSWRFPRGVYFRNDASQRKACGYIESINAAGGRGKRNICFEWQKLPDALTQSAGVMLIDDADPNDVMFERSGQVFNDSDTSLTLPATIDGEPVNPPRTRDNRTRTSRATFDRITATGPASSVRLFAGANPKQFAQAAAGRNANGNLASGSNFVEIGQDEYQPILDETIPLFSWTWGIPELFGAQVYADLRLMSDYYFYGRLQQINSNERLDMTTDARFGVYINVGVDIDVLFGLFFDAGAYVTGYAISTMPTVITNNAVTRSGPCFYFGMTFSGYVDPCNLCPTPVIEETYPIINTRTPDSCDFFDGTGTSEPLLTATKGAIAVSPVTALEQRQMRRHPAIAFGSDGNGQMLMLDAAETLRASAVENGVPQPGALLSSAPNARQPQVVYYAPDRAIAVWAESALSAAELPAADIQTQVRNQRIAYALNNGAGWLRKQYLTAPGTGEAFPALATCPAGRVGCPLGGEVTAVWQRNLSGDYRNPTNRIHYATFAPATGWTTPREVSSVASGVQDITPAVSYLGADSLVVWVRQQGADRNDFNQRVLAYRVIGAGSAQLATALPTGVIAPSLRTQGSATATVAFTKVDAGTGPIGTRQALHTATGTCSAGTCSWTWRRPTDRFGRAIYGERPQLLSTGGSDLSVVMRTFQFRGADGGSVQPGDPFGTVVSSGDLLNIQLDAGNGTARTVAISADGASHFGAAAAYNPMSEEIVTLAATYAPPSLLSVASAVKAAGFETQVAYGKAVASVGGIEMRALPATPDLLVESVTTNVSSVAPGAAIQATVRIGNRGAAYDTARDGTARVELRWNLATGTGAPLAAANLASLAAGDGRDVVLAFNAPATAFADEPHVLYAVIVPGDELVELSGDNNVGTREFAGLPVPVDLASFSTPGYAPVQLGWTASADPRVTGYRVYRLDGSEWVPLGSTPGNGFLDLSAQFGVARSYAVTSYSIRGVESARSAAVRVMPVITEQTEDGLFGNGFEPAAAAPR
jgi:hypothetical protein